MPDPVTAKFCVTLLSGIVATAGGPLLTGLDYGVDLFFAKLVPGRGNAASTLYRALATDLERFKQSEYPAPEAAALFDAALAQMAERPELRRYTAAQFMAHHLRPEAAAADLLKTLDLDADAGIRASAQAILEAFFAKLRHEEALLREITPDIDTAVLETRDAVLRIEAKGDAANAALAARYVGELAAKDQALSAKEGELAALRLAVAALTKNAETPGAPPDLEHALDRLAQGETDEARAVFAAILERKAQSAADKAAEAEADRREAAEAARHLGALASLDNTAEALKAYRRAADLDPDDAWTWIFIARLERVAGNLAAAESAATRAENAARAQSNERDVMVAQNERGDIYTAQGALAAAETAYQIAIRTAKALVERDSNNIEWQHDLSVSHNKIGDVQAAQGNPESALDAYTTSLALRKALVAHDPSNAERQCNLSVVYIKIGDVQMRTHDDLVGALNAYTASLDIRNALVACDPENAWWQRKLSVSHERVGDVRMAQRDFADAIKAYEASLAIAEMLVVRDPNNTEWQRDLSMSHIKIGDVRVAQRNFADALKAYLSSLTIIKALVECDSDNTEWQRDLSGSHEKIGNVRVAQRAYAGALRAYSISLALREKLAQRDPDNAGWQRDLIVSNVKLAEVQRNLKQAAKRYMVALQIARALDKAGRLAPADIWMIPEIERRLALVSR